MRTLEVQDSTNRYAFSLPSVTTADLLRKQKRLAQRGQKVMYLRCDWRISIHFVSFCIFCGQSAVAVFMIDGGETRKSLAGVEVRSPHVIECRSKVYMTMSFTCFIKSSCCSRMRIGKKILINFSSPRLTSTKVPNFTSGWVQYPARQETGECRAATSIKKRQSRDFSIPQLFTCGEENCVDENILKWDR